MSGIRQFRDAGAPYRLRMTGVGASTTSERARTVAVPRFTGGGRVEWARRDVPEPGPGELLLRVRANALCGTDVAQYRDGSAVTPGHEVAGVVAAAGAGTATTTGTAGVVYLMAYCGACRSCRAGATNQCLAKDGDLGFTRDGGLAPYAVVPERGFFPVGDDVPAAEATLLLDVMGTTRHALDRALALRPDAETVLVNRAGPVGLGLVAMARLLLGDGVRVLAAYDTPERRVLVERLGGIPVDGPVAGPVDVAFDTSGRAGPRRACLDALGRRGVLVCLAHGRDPALEVAVSADLIAPERAVVGSEYFRYADLAPNLALLRAHRPYLATIVTHTFPVADVGAAFAAFLSGRTGKVVVEHP